MENVTFVWNILKVVLGIGFVIFIHELGHFLLAKWNGVKVEKFSIGFGPTLVSYRPGVGLRIGTGSRPPGPNDPPSYGETEYIIAALPLGGYVKMLGEATEEPNENLDPETVEKSTDPRAFPNKSVGGRMAIITAGVIMNLILGFVCFSYVHTQPGVDLEPRIRGVVFGSPAMNAGLKAGDEIVAIDGRRDVSMTDVVKRIQLSKTGQVIHLQVHRDGVDGDKAIDVMPDVNRDSPLPAIGILYQAPSLELAKKRPFTMLPGQESIPTPAHFEGNDAVVGVGPVGGPIKPIGNQGDLTRQLEALRGEPMAVEVGREIADAAEAGKPPTLKRVQVEVPPHRFLGFGFRLTPGPITAIRPDSPASRAGLREGDRILGIAADQAGKDSTGYDPMRLPDLARDQAGTPWTIAVQRATAESGATEPVTITPESGSPWSDMISTSTRVAPLEVDGLGLAMTILPVVAAVDPGSPADKAGLKVGDKLWSIAITPEKSELMTGKTLTFDANPKGSAWPSAISLIQQIPVASVKFLVNDVKEPVEIKPVVEGERFHPLRGLNFQLATRPVPPASLGDALKLGAEDTWDNVTSIYKIFRSLAQKRVGGDAFGGVIPIAEVAYNAASAGFTTLVHFLGFLSIQLAVLNFLPIPPLDGGQFLFLAAEKVRGKPLPDSYLNAVTLAGIVLVLLLIVVINVKDVLQIFQSYF